MKRPSPTRIIAVMTILALALPTLALRTDAEAAPKKSETTVVDASGSMLVSRHPDGSSSSPLVSQALSGIVYVYATPSSRPASVRYYLDDPSASRPPLSTQANVPYGLLGGTSGALNPWDVSKVPTGQHTLTAAFEYRNGRTVIEHATFQVVAPAPEASPSPSPEPEPDASPASGGLTYSATELSVWKQRATSGPYRVSGDVSANSPGDWARIQSSASAFMSNPSAGRWSGPSGTGCVAAGAEDPPTSAMDRIRDAAFSSLVTSNDTMRQAVRQELLAQARTPGVNFADTSRWCTGRVYDNHPSFYIAFWMTRLMLAYDYVGADTFSAAENDVLRAWFWHAARWLQRDVDIKLDENFVNRYTGDYRLSSTRSANPGWGKIGHLTSQQTGAVARYYNNRRSTSMFFVALVGAQQNDATFKESSKRFFREWLMFSVYPDGWTGEFERWRSDLPDLGWAYSTYNVALAAMTADVYARQGDTELYRFTTSSGVHGTEGGSKSLHTVMRDHGRYLDGGYVRYGTDQSSSATSGYRIEGSHAASNWHSVHDVATTIGNLYYKDPYLKGIYTRTGAGTPAYPSRVASQGPFSAWQGVWGIYPGVMFMYGQMEQHSPY